MNVVSSSLSLSLSVCVESVAKPYATTVVARLLVMPLSPGEGNW